MKKIIVFALIVLSACSRQKKEAFIKVYAMNVKSLMASGTLGKYGSIETYFIGGPEETKDFIGRSFEEYENRKVKIDWFILELRIDSSSYKNIAYRMLDTLGKINFWKDADTAHFNWKGHPEARKEYKSTMDAMYNGFNRRFENIEYYIEESTLATQISRKGYLIYTP